MGYTTRMAPTATGNASLDQKPADDGGLSPAIWFLVAVVLIFFVLNVIRIFYNKRRRQIRSPPRNQEECTQTRPGDLIGRVQQAHVERRVKTGRIRIKELDKAFGSPRRILEYTTQPRGLLMSGSGSRSYREVGNPLRADLSGGHGFDPHQASIL